MMRPAARGFTLVECMVTIVIVTAVVGAIGTFTTQVLRSDNQAKVRTIATHIAEQLIEEWSATNDITSFNFTAAPAVGGTSSVTYTPASPVVPVTFTITASRKYGTAPTSDGSGSSSFDNGFELRVITLSWSQPTAPSTGSVTMVNGSVLP